MLREIAVRLECNECGKGRVVLRQDDDDLFELARPGDQVQDECPVCGGAFAELTDSTGFAHQEGLAKASGPP